MIKFRPNKRQTFAKEYIPKIRSDDLSHLLEASYKRNRKAENIGLKSGYKLNHQLSNSNHKLFTDKQDNPYIVFTGSRKVGDWLTDSALAVGLAGLSPRFRNERQYTKKIKEKYKNKPLTTLGHSLGGSLAESVSDLSDKTITVNKGTGIFGINRQLPHSQTDIRTGNDPVSLLSRGQTGGKKITIKNTRFVDPIHAHKYSHLEKLGDKKI
jgi:hypothetical protein